MAKCIPFEGHNRRFEVPLQAGDLLPSMLPMFGYNNKVLTFTRWKLTEAELEEINRTGEIWMAARTGARPMQPHWLGSLSWIKFCCAEMGGLWKKTKPSEQLA